MKKHLKVFRFYSGSLIGMPSLLRRVSIKSVILHTKFSYFGLFSKYHDI